jgi:hypothetical protein
MFVRVCISLSNHKVPLTDLIKIEDCVLQFCFSIMWQKFDWQKVTKKLSEFIKNQGNETQNIEFSVFIVNSTLQRMENSKVKETQINIFLHQFATIIRESVYRSWKSKFKSAKKSHLFVNVKCYIHVILRWTIIRKHLSALGLFTVYKNRV